MRTIVLIHGLAASKEIWFPLIPYMNNFHIINYELPGHGDSLNLDFDWQAVINELKFKTKYANETIYILHSFAAGYLPELKSLLKMDDKVFLVEGIIHLDDAHWTKSFNLESTSTPAGWLQKFKKGRTIALKIQLINKHSKENIEIWSSGFNKVRLQALLKNIKNFIKRLRKSEISNCLGEIADVITYVKGDNSNISKSSLDMLRNHGIKVYKVRSSAHFPMLDNPRGLSTIIKNVIDDAG